MRYLILLTVLAAPAGAADLAELFQLAEQSDPEYRAAQARYRAALESRPQARAALLPSVNFSADTTDNNQDISTAAQFFGAGGEVDFNTNSYTLSATQPVFHYDRIVALRQADAEINRAEAELSAAQQALIIRLAERYFDVLASQDSLDFARAELNALERQLNQASQRFEVGLIAITDVQEAQAAFDLATANEIQAVNQVDLAQEALREVIGEYARQLEPLGEKMPMLSPDPGDIEVWTQQALTQNLEIEAQRALVRQAAEEVKRQRAGHYPTLDIVGSYGQQISGGRFGATETDFTALGLELNVPLFSGGLVSSQVREAAHRYQESLQLLEQTARGVQRRTRDAYLGVESGISRVKALKQAVLSNLTSVEATKAGFEVGTRTTVDVVAAEQGLFRARRDYARARYDYIVNALRLREAAGSLSTADLLQVNSWLSEDPGVAPAAGKDGES